MIQLLCQLDTTDFPGWKRDFDAESTDRMEAGLTLLQMWRDADSRRTAASLSRIVSLSGSHPYGRFPPCGFPAAAFSASLRRMRSLLCSLSKRAHAPSVRATASTRS